MTYICTKNLFSNLGIKPFSEGREYAQVSYPEGFQPLTDGSICLESDCGCPWEVTDRPNGWRKYFVNPDDINIEELTDIINQENLVYVK